MHLTMEACIVKERWRNLRAMEREGDYECCGPSPYTLYSYRRSRRSHEGFGLLSLGLVEAGAV